MAYKKTRVKRQKFTAFKTRTTNSKLALFLHAHILTAHHVGNNL